MKKDNLKRIIKQFETLIEELKSEVYSDKDSYVHPWDEHMKNTPRIINTEDDEIFDIQNINQEDEEFSFSFDANNNSYEDEINDKWNCKVV